MTTKKEPGHRAQRTPAQVRPVFHIETLANEQEEEEEEEEEEDDFVLMPASILRLRGRVRI